MRAEPAEPMPELESEPEVALVEPVVDESPAHDEPDPASVLVPAGAVLVGVVLVVVVVVVVVPGSVVVDVVVGVVDVVVAVLSEVVAVFGDAAGAVVAVPLAGQVVVPVVPVVVAAGVVEPASTVESVWVCVRPASTVGVVVVFESLVAAAVPFLAAVLAASCLCVVDAAGFFAAGLWRWTGAIGVSIFVWTAGVLVTAAATVCGLGTEATVGVVTGAW